MDWSPYHLFCGRLGMTRQAAQQFLKEIDFASWNLELDRGRSFAAAVAELADRFPQHAKLIHAYDEQYLDTVAGSFQSVVEILQRLKEKGCTLYGLSNWSGEKFALVRPNYPFFEWIDGMVISGEVGLVKPERAIFELTLQRIGRPAGECIFIDDLEPNILVARDLGFQAIQFSQRDSW